VTPLPLATVTEVRRAFWDEHPALAARRHPTGRPSQEAVAAFGLYVAELARKGEMTRELINRVTL
jgi:hypothetical protein